jgi:hypothetical protein
MADCIPLHEVTSVRAMVQDNSRETFAASGASIFTRASYIMKSQVKSEMTVLSQSDEERFVNAIRIETTPNGYNSGT